MFCFVFIFFLFLSLPRFFVVVVSCCCCCFLLLLFFFRNGKKKQTETKQNMTNYKSELMKVELGVSLQNATSIVLCLGQFSARLLFHTDLESDTVIIIEPGKVSKTAGRPAKVQYITYQLGYVCVYIYII